MRPSSEERLDKIAVATYSLDLVAVAALLLSLGKAGEQELEAGPLSLVDALDTMYLMGLDEEFERGIDFVENMTFTAGKVRCAFLRLPDGGHPGTYVVVMLRRAPPFLSSRPPFVTSEAFYPLTLSRTTSRSSSAPTNSARPCSPSLTLPVACLCSV